MFEKKFTRKEFLLSIASFAALFAVSKVGAAKKLVSPQTKVQGNTSSYGNISEVTPNNSPYGGKRNA